MVLFVLLFCFFVFLFFISINFFLRSLILLEVISFMVLWFVPISLSSTFSLSLLLFIFCLVVLEGVIGLVILLNLIHYCGSDHPQPHTLLSLNPPII